MFSQSQRARSALISIGISRCLPVDDKLNAILTTNRHIDSDKQICDNPASVVPPARVLKNTDQVGFNDIPIDPDGIVRRGLLMINNGDRTLYSFSLRRALLYLQAEGITPQPDAVPDP